MHAIAHTLRYLIKIMSFILFFQSLHKTLSNLLRTCDSTTDNCTVSTSLIYCSQILRRIDFASARIGALIVSASFLNSSRFGPSTFLEYGVYPHKVVDTQSKPMFSCIHAFFICRAVRHGKNTVFMHIVDEILQLFPIRTITKRRIHSDHFTPCFK